MKKLLTALLLLPALSVANCDKLTGAWVGKSDNKPYAVNVNKDYISVTELEPERSPLSLNSYYRVEDCKMEFVLYREKEVVSVTIDFTNNSGIGYVDDHTGRHLIELVR